MPYSFILLSIIFLYFAFFPTKHKVGYFVMLFSFIMLLAGYFAEVFVVGNYLTINFLIFFGMMLMIFTLAYKIDIASITFSLFSIFLGMLNYQAIVAYDIIFVSTFNGLITILVAFFVCLPFIFLPKLYLFSCLSFYLVVEIYNTVFLISEIDFAASFDANLLQLISVNLTFVAVIYMFAYLLKKIFYKRKNKSFVAA